MGKANAAAWVGLALSGLVAIHEWTYHQQHSRSGPATVIAVLGLAGVLIAGAVLVALREIEQNRVIETARSTSAVRRLTQIETEITDLRIALSMNPDAAALLEALSDVDDE